MGRHVPTGALLQDSSPSYTDANLHVGPVRQKRHVPTFFAPYLCLRYLTCMPTLSLCMIVRDEADFLPQFLKSVEGVWDELVVLDTGSSDATKALLAAAGARVYDFCWGNDFAEARNACMAHATKDFILVLDADEIAEPGFVAEVRACINTPNVGAASVRIRSTMKFGHLHESDILRLYRRDFQVSYRFRVHEEVASSVEVALMATGMDYVHIVTPVVHLGYSREVCEARNKKQRDTTLLWACVAEDKFDLYSWYKLLEQGRFYKDEQLSQKAAQGAAAALDEVCDISGLKHFLPEMVVLLTEALVKQEPMKAQQILYRWAEKLPQSPSLLHARGQHREVCGEMALAAQDFQECLALDGKASNRQITTVRPRLGLARIALAQADLQTAKQHVDASLLLAPQDPEALLAQEFLATLVGPGATAYAPSR